MRLSTGARAWCRPSRRRSGQTPAGILLQVVVISVLAITLTGCEVIGGLMPEELRGSRSVPGEAICLDYQVLPADGQQVTPELLEQTRTIIEERVNALGVAEPIVSNQGEDHISVELPGLAAEDTYELRSLIGTTGVLRVHARSGRAAGQRRRGAAARGDAGRRASLHRRRDRQRGHLPGPHDGRDRDRPAAQVHRRAPVRRVRRGALRRAVCHRPRRRGHVRAVHPGHPLRGPGPDLRRPAEASPRTRPTDW